MFRRIFEHQRPESGPYHHNNPRSEGIAMQKPKSQLAVQAPEVLAAGRALRAAEERLRAAGDAAAAAQAAAAGAERAIAGKEALAQQLTQLLARRADVVAAFVAGDARREDVGNVTIQIAEVEAEISKAERTIDESQTLIEARDAARERERAAAAEVERLTYDARRAVAVQLMLEGIAAIEQAIDGYLVAIEAARFADALAGQPGRPYVMAALPSGFALPTIANAPEIWPRGIHHFQPYEWNRPMEERNRRFDVAREKAQALVEQTLAAA